MEPRPQRPSRATGPFISTGTPNPPSATATGGYGSQPFDASSAPPAPPPSIGYDPDYSPGQPLAPLRGPRGANIVGPLLAVAALAIIVAAVAFIVSQFRDGNDDDNANPTSVAAINASPTDEVDEEDANSTEPAGASTEEPGDDNAEPTNTPRINRTPQSGDEEPTEEDDSNDSPEERTRARQWLPTNSMVGDGYERTENDTRDAAAVAGSFPDAEDAATKLEEFGWKENAYRNFELENGGENDTTTINVSVHLFDTEAGARDALRYFADGGKTAQGLTELDDGPDLGEDTIALQGVIEGGNLYVLYIRQNEFVIRIGGLSVAGDPAETTTTIAERILEP
jgi:hypothetical protein